MSSTTSNWPLFLWINLEASKHRKQAMQELFAHHGIPNIRINAINGYDTKQLSSHYGLDPKMTFLENACTLSHLSAIEYFYENTTETWCIICEDDLTFEFQQFWPENLSNLLKGAPDDWEILQLSIIIDSSSESQKAALQDCKPGWIKRRDFFYSALAYAVNRKAAANLLTHFRGPTNKFNLNVSASKPAIADQIIFDLMNTYTYSCPLFTYPDNNDSVIHKWHSVSQSNSKKFMLDLWLAMKSIK